MRKKTWIWIGFGIFLVCFLFGIFVLFLLMAFRSGGRTASGNIALVHVEGLITSGKSAPAFLFGSQTGSESLLKILDRVAESSRFRAVVLRVNSPGGTAAASQEIYEKLLKIRQSTGKKIVVSMGDVAASGGYYVSCAADKIFAEPATITGSIGVIAELVNIQDLYKKIGIRQVILKAGRLKDIGSSSRPMTAEERKLFQDLLNETHHDFIQAVASGRKLPEKTVSRLADGRIYTGRQAHGLGLVDELGNLEDAEAEAGKLAGITGELKVVDLDRRSFLEQLSGVSPGDRLSFPALLFAPERIPSIRESLTTR